MYNDQIGPIIREWHDPCSQSELVETGAHVDLLGQGKIDQADSALCRHPETRIAVSEACNVRPQIWKRATDVYLVAMIAIAQSRSSIEELLSMVTSLEETKPIL